MCALTIEDGTIVEGADSYASLEEARAYASARGLSFPALSTEGDAKGEQLLRVGFDYLENLRDRYQGTKTELDQDSQFPRSGVVIDGQYLDAYTIPKELKRAQILLAIISQTQPLTVNSDGKEVIRKKIEGALETQFSQTGNAAPQPVFPAVDALLAPLFNSGSEIEGSFLSTARV